MKHRTKKQIVSIFLGVFMIFVFTNTTALAIDVTNPTTNDDTDIILGWNNYVSGTLYLNESEEVTKTIQFATMNTDTTETGKLKIVCSGDTDDFIVSPDTLKIPSIPKGETYDISVKAKSGLSVGEHNMTLEVISDDDNPTRIFSSAQTTFSVIIPQITTSTVGDFTVTTGGKLGTDYTYSNGLLTVLTDIPITIQNTNPSRVSTNRINIKNGNVTLAGINLKFNDDSSENFSLDICGNTNLYLSGTNTINGYKSSPSNYILPNGDKWNTWWQNVAINIYNNHSGAYVTIQNANETPGTLNVNGGIQVSRSTLTINSGIITAIGGYEQRTCEKIYKDIQNNGLPAIGISNHSTLNINGGTIKATSFGGSAALGTDNYHKIDSMGNSYGGGDKDVANPINDCSVNITGGNVTAETNVGYYPYENNGRIQNGAAIGGGSFNTCNVNISGGTIKASSNRYDCAIGSTQGASNVNISGGTITATNNYHSDGTIGSSHGTSNVTITGGNIDGYLTTYGATNGTQNGSKAVTEHEFSGYSANQSIESLPENVPSYYSLNDVKATWDGRLKLFYADPQTISVDITWGTMNFVYHDAQQTWNTQTHTWDTDGVGHWAADENSSNAIQIANKSSCGISAKLNFSSSKTDVDGAFTDTENRLTYNDTDKSYSLSMVKDTAYSVSFLPTGKLTEADTVLSQIGTITITIDEITDD